MTASAARRAAPAQAPGLLTDERAGWAPLPGTYSVLRWAAPVAVCTLADDDLTAAIANAPMPGVGIVGTLATENLGIERLVRNTIANPNLRFVVVCGSENDQKIGHRPGASLVALARSGVNDRQRIRDARADDPSSTTCTPTTSPAAATPSRSSISSAKCTSTGSSLPSPTARPATTGQRTAE